MGSGNGMFSLDGKVIVVTGGTRRYGFYMSEGLAEAGGTVLLTSRDAARAEETAALLCARGLNVRGRELRLEDDESIERFVRDAVAEHGRIDVLVNSARHTPRMAAFDIDRAELDRTFAINAVGTILLTRRVIEQMRRAGGGSIINIGSIYGMGGQDPGIYEVPDRNISLDYSLVKGGMIAWSRQLATAFARDGIRANCLSLAGLRETAVSDAVFLERYCKRTPMGRMAEGQDVKGPVVFLASDASSYVTGINLAVDGGWTAW